MHCTTNFAKGVPTSIPRGYCGRAEARHATVGDWGGAFGPHYFQLAGLLGEAAVPKGFAMSFGVLQCFYQMRLFVGVRLNL